MLTFNPEKLKWHLAWDVLIKSVFIKHKTTGLTTYCVPLSQTPLFPLPRFWRREDWGICLWRPWWRWSCPKDQRRSPACMREVELVPSRWTPGQRAHCSAAPPGGHCGSSSQQTPGSLRIIKSDDWTVTYISRSPNKGLVWSVSQWQTWRPWYIFQRS